MKGSLLAYIGWFLIAAILAFYGYGIYKGIALTWPKTEIDPKEYPAEILMSTVSSIQALLLANLGAVLGIAVTNRNSALAKQLMLHDTNNLKAIPPPPDVRETIQLIAVVIYLIGLVACTITWIHVNFNADSKFVVAVVPEAGKMFIGVALAYITALLAKK